MKKYSGVGSRETPPDVYSSMESLACALGLAGYTLRSGGAAGADSAFESGASTAHSAVEIYLPWADFNGNHSKLAGVSAEALAMAKAVHPRWEALGPGPRKMHARNCYQVLGAGLCEPSDFLVCWTADGCESEAMRTRHTGGTATGIVLALRNKVPVFNLRNNEARASLNQLLLSLGVQHAVPSSMTNTSQASLF